VLKPAPDMDVTIPRVRVHKHARSLSSERVVALSVGSLIEWTALSH
jgi:hypothetical protein